jgi:exodeoxyribonuclease V beta subunit
VSLYYPRPAALSALGPGHNVVESSAGTGKTFLLEHLFVDLIVGRAVPIEKILVVTYTEKATAELVLRLRALLGELDGLGPDHPKARQARTATPDERWLIDDAAKERIRKALLSFDRASIFTIHGFCQRILREHSFVQGRLFDESLVAEETMVRRAFRELLRSHDAGDGQVTRVLRAWLAAGRSVDKLEALICECAGKDATRVRPAFDEAQLVAAMRAWPDLPADEAALTARLKQAGVAGRSAGSVARRLAWLVEALAASAGDGLALLSARPGSPDKCLSEALVFARQRLPAAIADAALAKAAASVSALLGAAVPFDAAVVQVVLPLVRRRAAADKRRAGTFDFADMLALVGRALDETSPIRQTLLAALRRRYRYALIDEFQDTDEIQWSIFRRIFVDSPDGHSLTIIGDPKQAIYGFRGANVAAYLAARTELLAAGAPRLRLDRNFRSTADLIRTQNLLFADESRFFRADSGITYDRPVSCGATDRALEGRAGAACAPVVVLGLRTTETSLRAADAQAALRSAIVAEMRGLLGADPGLVLRGRPGGAASLRPRDIFVLTFTNHESWAMGEALGEAGIPFAFYKRGKLFESPEAEEILRVLRAVAEPEDRGLCAGAFLTRFFDLDLAQVAASIAVSGASEAMLRLRRWAGLARQGDIPALFASVLDDSGVLRREIFANGGERALTNTMHVFELLQAEWARSRVSLPELVDRLSCYIRGKEVLAGEDSDVQRLETEKDAVQILTVHMAKGLEADVVFLYGGSGERTDEPVRVFAEQGVRVLHVGRLDEDAKRAAAEDKADERSRLLYVAFTRARYRLYVPHFPPELGRLDGPYRQANEQLGRVALAPHPLFELRTIDCATPPMPAPAARAAVQPEAIPAELLTAPVEPPDIAAIRSERSGFLVTSYSAVKRAHDVHKPRPEGEVAPEVGRERRQGSDELPGGAETGIFLHDILATVSLPELAGRPAWADWFASPEVQGLLQRLARRHGRPPSDIAPSARLIHLAYTCEVRLADAVIPGLAGASPALREMEFLFPIPAPVHPLLGQASAPDRRRWRIERGVVKGFVDFLFEHQGRTYVCDWKSDTLPDYAQAALAPHCQQSYEIQARIYTIAALRLCGITTRAEFERRYGGVFFCFLRGLGEGGAGAGIHHFKPNWDSVLGWEKDMLDPRFWGAAP